MKVLEFKGYLNRMWKTKKHNTKDGKKAYITFAIALILFTIGVCVEFIQYSGSINAGIAEQVVRLHVIANSNSKEDQDLKLEVRDFILKTIEKEVNKNSSVSDCEEYVKKNISYLTKRVGEFVKSKGKNQSIKILLGEYSFPTKHYKEIDMPAGKYEAVRVILGEGKGENWWCVLFPPLCFADAKTGEIPVYAKEKLRQSLCEEEYNILTKARENPSYKLKFKTIEMFQTSKLRVSEIMDKLIY